MLILMLYFCQMFNIYEIIYSLSLYIYIYIQYIWVKTDNYLFKTAQKSCFLSCIPVNINQTAVVLFWLNNNNKKMQLTNTI